MSIAKLRSETAAIHSKLEKSLNLFQKVDNLESYKAHLRHYHHWLSPLEKSLNAIASTLPIGWKNRQRSALLEKDLSFLSVLPLVTTKNFKIQTPHTVPQCLGVLYTLEGSTLGGQFIYKHFSEKLNLNKDKGLTFYYGRGLVTGKLWKEFLQVLDHHIKDHPADTEEICHAARLTFEDVETALCAK